MSNDHHIKLKPTIQVLSVFRPLRVYSIRKKTSEFKNYKYKIDMKMNIRLFAVVFSFLICIVGSLRIFPLDNPQPLINAEDYKKTSGLTAGLLPGGIVTQAVTDDGTVQAPAKDLLPPKNEYGA